mgnify:FL=1
MKINTLILVTSLSIITILGCGNNDNSDSSEAGIVTSKIINEENNYSISDFEGAGLKKPKPLKADAVDKKTGEAITPKATEVYLGFYKSSFGPKDIEVRFYESHSDAINYGVDTAEETINAVVAFTNALIETTSAESTTSTAGYGAYVVIGNVIMICQGQIEVCEELIDDMK